MITCIIIEDQAPARRILQKYVEDYGSLKLLDSFSSALDALEYLKSHDVELIFLDIHLPKLSGIDFLKSLTKTPAIVLTTAFTEYAVQSYELDISDYLVKPFSFERFVKALQKAEQTIDLQNNRIREKYLFIKSGYEYFKVNPTEIIYIQSDMDYTEIHLEDRKYISQETLSYWENTLNAESFVRVHKSYLVNINCIDKVNGNNIHFTNSSSLIIPIGRAYKEFFLESYVKQKK